MSGTGNLLLKRKVAGNSASGIPAPGLSQAMPVLHLGGLARANSGVPIETYSNRLWVGMSSYGTGTDNENGVSAGQTGDINNYSSTRPIWMGAEIRAHTPIVNAVLKADWTASSDFVLATQKSIYEWAIATFQPFSGFQGISENDIALLGAPGAAIGTQSFLSPILIEQKLTVNAFSVNSVEQPATIHSESIDASIFDLNVETITLGGSAISIDIGNDSTANDTTTTIYGDLVVTGNSYLGVIDLGLIDGGNF